MVETMTEEKMQKFIQEFRDTNSQLLELEQRFAQLQQLAQQIEEERANLKLMAQNLIGRTEVLAEIIPEDERQKILDELRAELEARQAQAQAQAQQEQRAQGPAPMEEEALEPE